MAARSVIIACIVLLCTFVYRAAAQTELALRDVITGLDTPWEILWGPDDWIWITERPGRISRVHPQTGELRLLATIPDVEETDNGGLLGMALHPDFSDTPHVFVVYTYLVTGVIREKLVRYTYDGSTLASPVIIIDGITGNIRHDGSRVVFAPDRTLFMTTGDARTRQFAQSHASIAGKVLRMTTSGTAPPGNPHPNYPHPYSLIWSSGHRNAQGLVLARNGILYSSEHGQEKDDEVNIILPGRNYGWPTVEGYCDSTREMDFCRDSNVAEPMIAWTPSIAPSGIDHYTHNAIPEWRNALLMTTLRDTDLRVLELSEDGRSVTRSSVLFENRWGRLRDLCISPDGRVFIATSNRDQIGTPRPDDDRIVEIRAATTTAVRDAGARSAVALVQGEDGTAALVFELGEASATEIAIVDVRGAIVYASRVLVPAGSSRLGLPIGSLARGAYIVRARVGDEASELKLAVP